ncbi:hypothetical protein Moror_12108 [Moniliophthora roreri MCA 2997]|uniref:Uncharacterized protein n=1 Tax=Moniliophthora roreri (strain MCA 2997) TaxID=1381753 RepID=V2W3E3_MONRO|nr:hypothetical protein Moror_12108 [Moniliophthora roreri MCA 2997]
MKSMGKDIAVVTALWVPRIEASPKMKTAAMVHGIGSPTTLVSFSTTTPTKRPTFLFRNTTCIKAEYKLGPSQPSSSLQTIVWSAKLRKLALEQQTNQVSSRFLGIGDASVFVPFPPPRNEDDRKYPTTVIRPLLYKNGIGGGSIGGPRSAIPTRLQRQRARSVPIFAKMGGIQGSAVQAYMILGEYRTRIQQLVTQNSALALATDTGHLIDRNSHCPKLSKTRQSLGRIRTRYGTRYVLILGMGLILCSCPSNTTQ